MCNKLFTSESVGAGHPDKICDQIADAVLDDILKQDPNSRVACEVMASNHLIIIGGEITTKGYVDVVTTAWKILNFLGYKENDFAILSNVNSQSEDIKHSVDQKDGKIGAGDQGTAFGYATNETSSYMPLPIVLAHELVKLAEKLQQQKIFKWAKLDMKSQVTIAYCNHKPKIKKMLMSVQHQKDFNQQEFKNFIEHKIMKTVAKKNQLNTDFEILINPAGNFVKGGPAGDTGMTGRKIVVDTYGGKSHHGGGALSGKDYTKMDRFASYAARWIAKNLVAAKVADEIEVQISYAIGLSEPFAIAVNTFGTGKIAEIKILTLIKQVFDLSPIGIIKDLDLKKPVFLQVAKYGHFGREDLNLTWEQLNKVEIIKKIINNWK